MVSSAGRRNYDGEFGRGNPAGELGWLGEFGWSREFSWPSDFGL